MAVALLLAFAPGAGAQQQASLVLAADGLDEPLRASKGVAAVNVTATLVADPSAYSGIIGIPVAYTVTEQPSWLVVVVSPATDLFPAHSPSPGWTYQATRLFTVALHVLPNATGDALGKVEITAVTTSGPGGRAVAGAVSFPVRLVDDRPSCAPTAVDEPAPVEDEPATTIQVQQSGSAAARVPWATIAGFGIAGAGVGLVLRRRA